MKAHKMVFMSLLIILLTVCTSALEIPLGEGLQRLESIGEPHIDEALSSGENKINEGEVIAKADFSPYELEATYDGCTYILAVPADDWHCKIYKVDDEKVEVFDLAKDPIRARMESQKAPQRMVVSDEDGDAAEEIYLFFEHEIGSSWMLVLNRYVAFKEGRNRFQAVYYGLSENVPQYLNIDGQGKAELMTEHSGGGGYVSVWEGLQLANVYRVDQNMYGYSYRMTKKYYEDLQKMAEKNIILNPTEQGYAILLKNLAHQGKIADCKKIIEEADAIKLKLEPDWQGPYETYYEYILAQASYYEDIWLQIKGWDISIEEELKPEEISPVAPITKVDLELENGLFLGMSYDDFCERFAYNETLAFNVGEDGNSTGRAQLKMGTVQLVFEWSPENTSSPLLIEYAVKDQLLKTNRGIGLGCDISSIIKAYGEPDVIQIDAVGYFVGDVQLVFDLKEDVLIQYRIDNGTGLLVE